MSNGHDNYTPAQWAQILKNAQQALQLNPQNARAMAAFKAAQPHVAAERQRVNAAEKAEAAPGPIESAIRSTAFGIRPTARPSDYARLQEGRAAHPWISTASNIAGAVASPVNRVLSGVTAGVGPKLTGAIHGGVLGAIQGGAEAEARGGNTLRGAEVGAALGVPLGIAGGYAAQKLGPGVSQILQNLKRMGRSAGTTEEQAVAKALGLSIEQVRGRVNVPPPASPVNMAPTPKAAPDPFDVPTFLRRGSLEPQIGGGGYALPGSPNAMPPIGLLSPAAPASGETFVTMSAQEFNSPKVKSMLGAQVWDAINAIRLRLAQ